MKRCVCIHEIIQLIITNMKMKMKNISHRYDVHRSRSSKKHKYSKYKKCLTIMMLICIKQDLSNMKKLSNTEAEKNH